MARKTFKLDFRARLNSRVLQKLTGLELNLIKAG